MADLRVLATAVEGVAVFEARKRAGPLSDLVGRFEPASQRRSLEDPERAVRLVTGLLRRLYGRRFCLPRSLVLYRLLGEAGWPVRFHTGVRRTAGGLDGHAWVSVDGLAIGERVDPTARFALTFSHPFRPDPGTLPHGPFHALGRALRGPLATT